MKFESQTFKIAADDNGEVVSREMFGLVSPSGLFAIDQRGLSDYCVTHIPTGHNFNKVFTGVFLDEAIEFVERLESVADAFRMGKFGETPTDEHMDKLKKLVEEMMGDEEE